MRDWRGCGDVEHALLIAAHAGHEVRRAYALALGLPSGPAFCQLSDNEKDHIVRSVTLLLSESSTEKVHGLWVLEKEKSGWKYGDHKDHEHKTDPFMVPYFQLPDQVKIMDGLFLRAVTGALVEHGLVEIEESEM